MLYSPKMKDCIFCRIIKGEIPSAKVFEDKDTLAFLDVNPVSKWHCLVVPKKHFQDVFDINSNDFQKIILAGKGLAKRLKEKLKADGVNLLQSNGKSAGQVIFHFHLHVIPRYNDDGLRTHGLFGEKSESRSVEELKKLAEEINS